MVSKAFTGALAALAACSLASAQTTTNCDPSKGDKCPANPAFGGDKSYDFTSAPSIDALGDFWNVDDGIKYDSKVMTLDKNGASFVSYKEGNAPILISKQYLFFGKVEVELQAAPGQGVITAITLQSDDRDEIDFEFVGSHQDTVETNFYSKGVDDYGQGRKVPVSFNPMTSSHKYAVEWTPTFITFSVDGKVIRTATPAEAHNGASYPQTPCQVRIGTWLGGGKDKPQGTVDWAGGHVDWSKGPFTAVVKNVRVWDYGGGVAGAKEYSYGDTSGSWQSIKVVGGSKAEMPGGPGGQIAAPSPVPSATGSPHSPDEPHVSSDAGSTASSTTLATSASASPSAGTNSTMTAPKPSSSSTKTSTSPSSSQTTSGVARNAAPVALVLLASLLFV